MSAPETSPSASTSAVGPSRTPKTRSRNGCLVCRARRIRCDEAKPECAKCIKYSAECVYPSKKAFDPGAIAASLSKRHKNGSSSELNVLPASPSPQLSPYVPYSRPPAPPFAALNRPLLPSGISHESLPDNSRHGVSSRPDPLDRSVPSLMSGASSDPSNGAGGAHGGKDVDRAASMENVMRMPQLSKLDPHLQPIDIPQVQQVFTDPNELQHLDQVVQYSMAILASKEEVNPWIKHIAPLFLFPADNVALSAEALKYSMLGLGATRQAFLHDRAQLTSDNEDLQSSRRYRHHALSLLRQARQIPDEFMSDTFLAAACAVVHNDVLAAEATWQEHWYYACEAVAARHGCETLLYGRSRRELPSGVGKILVEFVVNADLAMSLSTGRPPTLLYPGTDWWERSTQDPGNIEVVRGVSAGMVRLATRAAKLLSDKLVLRQHGISPMHSIRVTAIDLFGLSPYAVLEAWKRSIHGLEHDLHTWRVDSDQQPPNPRTTVGNLAFWHMCQIIVRRYLQGMDLTEHGVQMGSRAILDLCIEPRERTEFLHWPFMIASSVLTDPALRDQSRVIAKMLAYQSCSEMYAAKDVLEEMWRRMDAGWHAETWEWVNVFGQLGKTVLFA